MVSIKNLKKNYGDYSLDISMEVPDGRIIGLVGKNGAGKSTTIKSILGLIKPDGGEVSVFGKDATTLSAADKERIGVMLSDSGFSMYLCAADIAKILSKLYKQCDPNEFLRKCKEQGLPEKKLIKDYSTGMKAKLRVLVALSHNADLLIMDEPTAGLDVEARNEILDILRDYLTRDENRSILITSHIATDLEELCDEIYLLQKGKIILHEDTDVILSEYAVLKVDEETYSKLDKEHIIKAKKENFGYKCLTKELKYYKENYPDIVIEKTGIDDLILILTGDK